MALYKATKNLVFKKLGTSVIVDEIIELEEDYADEVNNDLKLAFPDVPAVLVAVDETGEPIKVDKPDEVEKPKKSTRGRKTTETDTVEVVAAE